MKSLFYSAVFLLGVVVVARADDLTDLQESSADPRIFFANFTSSLVQVNATILTYALIAIAVIGAAAIALYYLFLESQQSSGYGYGYNQGYSSEYNYNYAR